MTDKKNNLLNIEDRYKMLRQIMWDYDIPPEELTEIRQKCKSMFCGRLNEIASPASRDRNDVDVKIVTNMMLKQEKKQRTIQLICHSISSRSVCADKEP